MSYPTEKNKQYLIDRYREQRAMFIERLGGKCAKCGVKENLEIDHKRWEEKSFNIARLWPESKLPMVYEELKKCQLLCSDCHLSKTRVDLSNIMHSKYEFTHGTFYGWMRKKCTCEVCLAHKASFYDKRNKKRRKGGLEPTKGVYGRPADHGEMLKYKRGCRCAECRRANAEKVKADRLRKKQEREA